MSQTGTELLVASTADTSECPHGVQVTVPELLIDRPS